MAIGMVVGLRNARLDAISTYAGNSGKLRVYSGTRPATGGTATTILAELTMNATVAPGAASGVLTFNAIAADASADATGTATWARLLKSDGTTIVMDLDVGTSGSDINFNSVSFVTGGNVAMSSWTITEANAQVVVGYPIFDCAVRTSNVTQNAAMVQLVPPAAALGTGRMVRLREVWISNTTTTAFTVGLGIATAAAVTPGGAGTPVRRSNGVGAIDPAPISLVWTTAATTPTAPTGFHRRLSIPGSSLVIATWNEGEELMIPPAATPLPFCIWTTSAAGQISDVSLSWEE